MNKAFWHTEQLAEQFGKCIALISPRFENDREVEVKKISYQQLHLLVQQAKTKLSEQFIDDDSTSKRLVMLTAHHSVNSVVYYLAALQLEWVVWWVDAELAQEKKQMLINHYQVNILINNGDISIINSLQHKFDDELALLMTTSGSTGSPTLIKLSYQNLRCNCQAICNTLALQQTDTVLTTLPLHYSFGLSILNTHLNQGTSIVLNEHGMLTRQFWQTFKQYNIRSLYGVPYNYQMLLKLNLKRLSLDSLRFFAVAGGKLLPEQVRQINDWCLSKNKLFFVMYGQTEATARISILSPEKVQKKPYSIGQAIEGGELWLSAFESSDGENSNDFSSPIGELCYSGNNVMMGVAKNNAELSLPAQNLTLHTGDLATCDTDGDYQIIGRLKRFIKIVGQRINLDEVELFFSTIKLTAFCCGSDDSLHCYLLKTSMKDEQSPASCQKLVGQFLNIHTSYCQCFIVDEIPYLSSGKVDYLQLPKLALSTAAKKEESE